MAKAGRSTPQKCRRKTSLTYRARAHTDTAHRVGQWSSDVIVSTEPCRFGFFWVQIGPGAYIGPSGTDGAKVRGHIGRAAARGERVAARGRNHGGGSVRASCNARGQTWAVAHVRFVFALGGGSVGASSGHSRALSASFRTSSSMALNFGHGP